MAREESDSRVHGRAGAGAGRRAKRPRTSSRRSWNGLPQQSEKGSTEQIIGDYYGACMNESRVNARGVEPLKPWFAENRRGQETWPRCSAC